MITIRRALIVALFVIIVGAITAYALMSNRVVIPNRASISTVGIEVDVESVEWGLVDPNSSVTRTINVWSSGTAPVTLAMSTGNWTPAEYESYITISWNYTDGTLVYDTPTPIELTLFAAADVIDIVDTVGAEFSFDITIVGTKA